MLKHTHLKRIIVSVAFSLFGLTHSIHSAEPLPVTLQEVGVTEHVGTQLDKTLTFKTHDGESVILEDYFNKNIPTIINIAYYSCPMLCHLVAGGVSDGINGLNLQLGFDYQILSISIDPSDTNETASGFRDKYLKTLEKPHQDGWKFLYGSQDQISKLTEQLGFSYRFNKKTNQFAHSAAIILLDKNATISRYLYGIEYKPFDLKMGLLESSDHNSRSAVERVLLFCYNYDPLSRKYVLFAKNVMKLGGILTIFLMLVGFIILQRTRK